MFGKTGPKSVAFWHSDTARLERKANRDATNTHMLWKNGTNFLSMKWMKEGNACFMQQLKLVLVPLASVTVKWTSLQRGLNNLHFQVETSALQDLLGVRRTTDVSLSCNELLWPASLSAVKKVPSLGKKLCKLNMTGSPDVFLRHVEHRYSQHHFSYTALYVGENYLILNFELIMSYMSSIYQGWVEWGCEQPDLLKDGPAHGKGCGLEDL